MKTINIEAYNELIYGSQVLISDKSGKSMVLLSTGSRIIKKLPYKKGILSKSRSRAFRFQENCKRLSFHGFRTLIVADVFNFPEESCHVVIYPIIEGLSLEEYIDGDAEESKKQDMMMRIAVYYGKLHNKGVYCRPTHFRNIIICPDSEFALIDVQNIRFRRFSLDLWTRSRNFKYILKYQKNLDQLIRLGAEDFFNFYMSECRMGKRKQKIFQSLLQRNVPALFLEGKFRSFA